MSFKDSKVVIVGLGNVGATTAYSIINQGLCEEIVLIDINKEKDLVSLAQYYVNENQSRAKLNKKLIEEFFQDLDLTAQVLFLLAQDFF